jgi:hypothetical protein
MNSALVGCFERWRDQAAEDKQMKTKALKVVQRLMNSALGVCFERWHDQVVQEKQMKAKALKVVQRLMNSALVLGFDIWKDWQSERNRTRVVLAKALTRMMNIAISAAFCSWKLQANRIRKLRVIKDKSCHKTLSSAFRNWRTCNMMFEILCAWKNSFLSSQLFQRKFPSRIVCFHRWILFVVQSKHVFRTSHESFLHKSRCLQYICGSACKGAGFWRLWEGDSVGERKTVVRLCHLSDSCETSDLFRTRMLAYANACSAPPLESKARVYIHLQALTNEVFHNLVLLLSAETRCA